MQGHKYQVKKGRQVGKLYIEHLLGLKLSFGEREVVCGAKRVKRVGSADLVAKLGAIWAVARISDEKDCVILVQDEERAREVLDLMFEMLKTLEPLRDGWSKTLTAKEGLAQVRVIPLDDKPEIRLHAVNPQVLLVLDPAEYSDRGIRQAQVTVLSPRVEECLVLGTRMTQRERLGWALRSDTATK